MAFKKTIQHKTIDSNYFDDEINEFIHGEDGLKYLGSVISITSDGRFTTLWYWTEDPNSDL